MSAGRQRPMIALAHDFDGDIDIDVTYTVASAETLTITLDGLRRYNDLSSNANVDLLAYVVSELNAESVHTWAGDDPVSGDATPGRTRITCTPTVGALASVTIPAALGLLLGFDTTTPTVTANAITSSHTRAGCWIPGPANEIFVLMHHGEAQKRAVMTEGVSGPLDNAVYGEAVEHRLMVSRIFAPFVWDDYAEDSAFVAFDPALSTSDPNLSFEALCMAWATSQTLSARFYPDHTDTSSVYSVRPGPWVNRPGDVLAQTGSRAKLRYDLTCTLWEQ